MNLSILLFTRNPSTWTLNLTPLSYGRTSLYRFSLLFLYYIFIFFLLSIRLFPLACKHMLISPSERKRLPFWPQISLHLPISLLLFRAKGSPFPLPFSFHSLMFYSLPLHQTQLLPRPSNDLAKSNGQPQPSSSNSIWKRKTTFFLFWKTFFFGVQYSIVTLFSTHLIVYSFPVSFSDFSSFP